MLAILSPAKSLDYETELATKKASLPQFVQESGELIDALRGYEPAELAGLMHISDNLAELNYRRNLEWQPCFDCDNARPAALAFKGDVYLGLQASTMSERDFTWAQKHVRILSGLYGLLRPLDMIRPYRLEMGTKLPTKHGQTLYDFWGDKLTQALNEAIAEQQQPVLINLASNEYFNVLAPTAIDARIINVHFKERKDGKLRFLSLFAKRARGLMTRYMVDKRVKTISALKQFDYDGYTYSASLSDGDEWVFTREQPPAG